ncbi:MAG: PorT family protein [Bacteroidales bacterium]|nr:PorT family protein [Bacteroidales bacterium]
MKNLFLGLFVAIALGASAQIEAGKLIVGGGFNFSTSSEKATAPTAVDIDKTMNFKLMPEIGFMVSENLAAGLGIGYNYTKYTEFDAIVTTTGTTDDISKTGMFSFMPFARYYTNTGERAFAFAEFALPIGMGSYKSLKLNNAGDGTEDADPFKVSTFGVQLSVGFNYFLNDKCAIEAKWMGLDFNSVKSTQVNGGFDPNTGNTVDNVSKTSGIQLGADLTALSIGLKIFM